MLRSTMSLEVSTKYQHDTSQNLNLYVSFFNLGSKHEIIFQTL